MEQRIKDAREALLAVCERYVKLLAEKWDLDWHEAYWVGNELGGLCDFDGDFTITLTDMVYVVENDASYAEYMEWMNYNIDAHRWGFHNINLKSWHMGAPRVSNDVFIHLQELMTKVNEAINEHGGDASKAEHNRV
jgi:hypothetical protein